ncbi:MAG: homoserine kinase, partial [Pyrobaculum sp.]|nr:homoserine kinase [Pyrobaculum sp.]
MRAYSTSANLGSGFDVVAVAHDAYFAEAYVKVGSGCG